MAIGPVVEDVADDFARYWYCKSVSPLQQVLDVPEGEMADRIELPASGITMPWRIVTYAKWNPVRL